VAVLDHDHGAFVAVGEIMEHHFAVRSEDGGESFHEGLEKSEFFLDSFQKELLQKNI
jgi:hypothetical protein